MDPQVHCWECSLPTPWQPPPHPPATPVAALWGEYDKLGLPQPFTTTTSSRGHRFCFYSTERGAKIQRVKSGPEAHSQEVVTGGSEPLSPTPHVSAPHQQRSPDPLSFLHRTLLLLFLA